MYQVRVTLFAAILLEKSSRGRLFPGAQSSFFFGEIAGEIGKKNKTLTFLPRYTTKHTTAVQVLIKKKKEDYKTNNMPTEIKLVVMGSGGVGKSAITVRDLVFLSFLN